MNSRTSSISCFLFASLLYSAITITPGFAQSILPRGTVNSADYSRSFAPGAIISIFGTNLSTATAQATSFPLPIILAGTSVELVSNSQQLPLFFVSSGQINAELPFDVSPGPLQIRVRTASGISDPDSITVAPQAPKLFTLDSTGAGSAVATTTDFHVLTSANPVKPADVLVLWMNSLGATIGAPVAGQPAPGTVTGSQPLSLVATPVVTIDGVNAPVLFAGLTPGMSGLYQLNVQAPAVTLTGPVDIQVSVGGVSTQANVNIPFRQLGFYYSVLGGKAVAGQTRNGVSGSTSALAFRQSDTTVWGETGYNAWTANTGLTSVYAATPGLALTLRSGTSIVYDNNGIENGSFGTFYDNSGGPPNDQKPGLADLYSMSNYFPLVFAGYFKISQATTVTELIGYFDPAGSVTLPFDPGNPYLKYRINIWSMANGGLPTETNGFVGDVFSSDTVAGTFSYTDTGTKIFSKLPSDDPKSIYRLSYKLSAPVTLAPGEYWLSHDASLRGTPAASSTAKSIREDAIRHYISSQKVEHRSVRFGFFGQEMFMTNSWTLPEAIEIRPSAPIQPR